MIPNGMAPGGKATVGRKGNRAHAHHCDACGRRGTIYNVRTDPDGIRRRRYKCQCTNRWTTFEAKATSDSAAHQD